MALVGPSLCPYINFTTKQFFSCLSSIFLPFKAPQVDQMLFQVFETAAKAAIAKKKSYVPSLKLCTLLWKTVALCLSSLIEKVFTLIECRNMHKSTVPGPLTQQCYRIAWLSGIQRLSIAWPSPEPKGILCHGCIWVQSRPSVWLPTRTALLDKSWTFLLLYIVTNTWLEG